jgi:hypothetical protein
LRLAKDGGPFCVREAHLPQAPAARNAALNPRERLSCCIDTSTPRGRDLGLRKQAKAAERRAAAGIDV